MRRQSLYIEGRRLSYLVAGDRNNPAIFLLHGWSAEAALFEPIGDSLAEDFFVIVPDLPGFGRSEPAREAWFLDLARILNQLMSRLEASEAIFVGHSMGGGVGIAFANAFPAQTKALVLLDSSNLCPNRSLPGWIWVGLKKTVRSFLKNRAAAYQVVRVAAKNWRRNPVWMWRTFRLTTQHQFLAEVRELGIPLTIIWAADDEYYPSWQESSEALGIKLVLVMEGGHDWPILNPSLASRLIKAALAGERR